MGDFHTALGLSEPLQGEAGLPPRLRQRIHEFADAVRQRRTQWAAGLALTAGAD